MWEVDSTAIPACWRVLRYDLGATGVNDNALGLGDVHGVLGHGGDWGWMDGGRAFFCWTEWEFWAFLLNFSTGVDPSRSFLCGKNLLVRIGVLNRLMMDRVAVPYVCPTLGCFLQYRFKQCSSRAKQRKTQKSGKQGFKVSVFLEQASDLIGFSCGMEWLSGNPGDKTVSLS